MKIAWVTPFSKKTAISQYSKSATIALSPYADVDLFITEQEDIHTTSLHTVHYTPSNVLSLLEAYDICIYNMGNNTKHHLLIYDVMKKRPGIVILHDLCYHHFFQDYYFSCLQKPEKYIETLVKFYGEKDANRILKALWSYRDWWAFNLDDYHMTEKLYPYSLGIVVHSNYHASKIKSGYDGPICIVPHPLFDIGWNIDNLCKNFDGYDSSKINLLTVGHIMPPKRIHSTIQAIGSDKELRRNVHFTCIGYQGDEKYLKLLHEQITKMRLEENIRLLGYVEYDQLANYYKHADIIVNLRYPVFEGASGSLVEQMQLGKIIIVSDTGVYSEMPDDCVIKIDPHNDVKELKRALKDFIRDPQKRDKYGTNAMSYAKKTFSPAHYGEKLFNFIQSVQFLSPLYSLTDVIAQELKTMGISPDMRTFDNISKEIEVLYG